MAYDRIIDDIDRLILTILQSDGRIANAEVARRVGLAPSAVLERIRKLETQGLIQGYGARVNARQVGQGLLAFVFVRTDERAGQLDPARRLAELPEVQEVHHIAGEDCYLAKVRVSDPEALGRLLRERIGMIPSVRSTRTTVVLETLKESSVVPVGPARPGRGRAPRGAKGRSRG